MAMGMKGRAKVVRLERRRGSWDFGNSTLDVEEGEGDRGETLGSKRGETGEGEL